MSVQPLDIHEREWHCNLNRSVALCQDVLWEHITNVAEAAWFVKPQTTCSGHMVGHHPKLCKHWQVIPVWGPTGITQTVWYKFGISLV